MEFRQQTHKYTLRYTLMVCCLVFLASQPGKIQAANGLYMTGYGARSSGMGGANLALGGSVMDLESNPANLAGLPATILEAGVRLNYTELGYQDLNYDERPVLAYNNDETASLRAGLPYGGFAKPLGRDLTVGLALYLQGGGGGQFAGIRRNTPTGQTLNEYLGYDLPFVGESSQLSESIEAQMMNARLTPGIAFRLGRNVKVGFALDAVYGRVRLDWKYMDPSGQVELPGTGIKYKSDPAYALGGKAGLTWAVSESLSLALAYTTPVKLHMDGGMRVNTGDLKYYRKTGVSMEQIWPGVYRGGLLYKIGKVKIAFDLEYIAWSGAFNTMDFKLEDPYIKTPLGTHSSVMSLNHAWRDQRVFALGFEYRPREITYRMGYNYGRTPVDGVGINPLFATTTEHHITLGLGWKFERTELDLAVEYAPPNRVAGENFSNWDLSHAVYGVDRIRTPFFQHSKKMSLYSLSMGVKYAYR